MCCFFFVVFFFFVVVVVFLCVCVFFFVFFFLFFFLFFFCFFFTYFSCRNTIYMFWLFCDHLSRLGVYIEIPASCVSLRTQSNIYVLLCFSIVLTISDVKFQVHL